ncbi:MAG: chromate efflux transporter [Rhodospirillales bacterium]|nr:chromate efflux transporter [Rhodospirillales bacterium]
MTDTGSTTVSRVEAFWVFLKVGLLSFGGPAAQIALMHRIFVDERKWLSEKQFLGALSFCMLLPGPEAMQLATYVGWRLHGNFGGFIAGLLFVVPGALVVFALSALYVTFGEVPLVDMLFLGVQAAAVVIVIEALLRVSKRALNGASHWVIAGCAFSAIFFFDVPYPIIVLGAGLYGAWSASAAQDGTLAALPAGSLLRTTVTIGLGLCVWFIPVIALAGVPILMDIGIFFSKLAVVTFGGAYAVLAYMAQDVVTEFGWLTATEMMDGLGLAETTPGPLILVTQFVGFVAGYREGGMGLGILGALVTLWVTFIPCFVWIFAGAPYIEHIAAQPKLAGALHAITAAVVGVILNLSVWFGLHVLFREIVEHRIGLLTLWVPDVVSINPVSAILILLSGYMLLWRHMGIGWVLALSAVAALLLDMLMAL